MYGSAVGPITNLFHVLPLLSVYSAELQQNEHARIAVDAAGASDRLRASLWWVGMSLNVTNVLCVSPVHVCATESSALLVVGISSCICNTGHSQHFICFISCSYNHCPLAAL